MSRPRLASTLVPLLLAGCVSVPQVEPQLAPTPPAALGLSDQTPEIAADWWHAFGDPQLDRLIAAGLAGNPRLAGAQARVREAQAQLGITRSERAPQVDVSGQVARQRFSGNAVIPPPYGGTTRWLPELDATLAWDLDLFGRIAAREDQATAQAQAARYEAEAARLTLSTAIAQTYVGLAQADGQLAVADRFVASRQQGLQLAQANVASGLASDFDLRQAETLLAEADQARKRATESRDMLVHALAALVGRGADFYGDITAPTLALDAAPTVPDTLPADLLGRRPDILAGRSRIEAAAAGRDEARAQFLPNINITALAGLASVGLGNFFDLGSRQYGVTPAIHLPIFEGGRLKAQYRGATAAVDSAIAEYNSAVLGAVRDAADAITGVAAADSALGDQMRIVGGLRETVRLDQVRVDSGLGSRIDTLESGFRLLAAEQALVDLQAEALTRRIQLIAALGGGFASETTASADIHTPDISS